ncbi:MAG: GNAT family N-acetyltransferase [Rhizobiales bacterium]|nr:GNAT family N-acetyltransferase [Hyphomicrobiales bacterium]
MSIRLEERSPLTYREACIPVLETERLVLRAPQLEDVKAIAALANDRRIAENTRRIPHPYTISDAEHFVSGLHASPDEMAMLVTLQDGTVIGCCGLNIVDGPVPELGYWLGQRYWDQGYATEAVRALIDHAFGDLGHEALHAGARVTNPASRRILEKCGFQWTGVGLVRIRAISSSAPIDQFRLDRGLWASLKSWRAVRRVA